VETFYRRIVFKMAGAGSEFHVWLCSRLKSLNLDEEVLGEYISGILVGDDSTPEEKEEALKETLEGMMVFIHLSI
jgi:hypothetical protein